MTTIALDTNIWIYLPKEEFHELWTRLKEGKEKGEFKILVNDVILKEWERNKETTINNLAKSIKEEYRCSKNLANHLSGEAKANFLDSLSAYKDEAQRIAKATARVEEVESFMRSCEIFETTQAQKLFISNLAINKLPPFQNNKNNFNDALIFRSICEVTNSSFPSLYDLIYVSNNPDDFIDKNTKEVHTSLTEGLAPISLKNVTQLGEALELAPEFIEDLDDWVDTQLDNQAMYDLDIIRGK